MALTYQDLKDLLDRPNIRLDDHISIWDGEECREVENCYINNSDSPTSDILDPGHLVLTLKE